MRSESISEVPEVAVDIEVFASGIDIDAGSIPKKRGSGASLSWYSEETRQGASGVCSGIAKR